MPVQTNTTNVSMCTTKITYVGCSDKRLGLSQTIIHKLFSCLAPRVEFVNCRRMEEGAKSSFMFTNIRMCFNYSVHSSVERQAHTHPIVFMSPPFVLFLSSARLRLLIGPEPGAQRRSLHHHNTPFLLRAFQEIRGRACKLLIDIAYARQ